MTRFAFPSMALVAALLAPPLAAQQSVQDFQLPPNPTPTPTVEGPVDERGRIAIPPRAIPTATPAPTPAPSPTATIAPATTASPTPSASGTPVVQPLPDARPPASQPLTPTASPLQEPAPQPISSPTPTPSETPSALEGLPGIAIEPIAPAQPAQGNTGEADQVQWRTLPEWWPWAAGLLTALIAGLGGGWWIARRRATRPAPTIEPPVVEGQRGQTSIVGKTPVHLTFEAEQVMRSMMMLTLKYRLTIANRSDQPLRDLSVHADMVSARRSLPVEQQVATAGTSLPLLQMIERIGPNQSATVTGQLQLPVDAIEVFQQGNMPLCVPLARLRVSGPAFDPVLRTCLVGIGSNQIGGKLHPLPLAGPPGGYEGVRTKPLD